MDQNPILATEPISRDGLWEYDDVAQYLKVTSATVRKYVRDLGLPCRRVGYRVLFRPAEVDAWVEAHGAPSPSGDAA